MEGTSHGRRKVWKGVLQQLGLGAALSILVVLLTQDFLFEFTPLKRMELATLDYRFQWRGSIPILRDTSRIIIVEISQESFRSLPDKWPWPRSYYARLVRNLKQAGAAVVGVDIIFSEPDGRSHANDEEFRRAIAETRNVVLAGKTELVTGDFVLRRENENYSNLFFDVDSSLGIVYLRNDDDGVYRRYRPFVVDPGTRKRLPSFSFAVLNKIFARPPMYTAENLPDVFEYAGRRIPKYDPTSFLINFYGPDRTFRHIKIADVIDDRNFVTIDEQETGEDINTFDDPDFGYLYDGTFKDKIVLVGSTMPEDKDLFPVPMAQGKQAGDNLMYGVEIHANMIQNVLDGNFLTRQPQWLEILAIMLCCIIIFLATTIISGLRMRAHLVKDLLGAVIMIAGLASLLFLSLELFSRLNYVIAVVSPAIAIMTGFVGATVYNYVTERRQKMMIKGMFSTYVSPAVVDEILAHPEKLRLGGERKELTVMFTDIEGFTSFAERMEPEALVSVLNDYLSVMTEIIFRHEGTLDKYEGDAIMAFWGAPIPQTDHALRACQAAVEMQNTLVELRRRWKAEGRPWINVRIGINTGEMIVGNMGGTGRFDYTVIGDSVNLGARFESANKQYRTNNMIGEETLSHIKDKVIVRQLDLIIVKGKTRPVAIYELIVMAGDGIPPSKLALLEMYNHGVAQYRNRDWKGAYTSFEKALAIEPDDYPSHIFMERSSIYVKSPPGPDWDGVFILRTK